MNKFIKKELSNQHIEFVKGPKEYPRAPKGIKVFQDNHIVHWETYGRGVAVSNIMVSKGQDDGVPWISFDTEEIKLASKNSGTKRDVSKRTMITLYGDAVYELFEILRETLEPVEPKSDVTS